MPEPWRAVETYLRSLHDDRASGEAVAETSGYGALQDLLNAAGAGGDQHKELGAGIPDGGLFTADQFAREEEKVAARPGPETDFNLLCPPSHRQDRGLDVL